jgi:hypothetical protein
MSKLKLKTQIVVNEPYKGKSKFEFFTKMRVGDVIEIYTFIQPIARGSHSGLYATQVVVKNLTQPDINDFSDSITGISKYLEKIQFTEINENS